MDLREIQRRKAEFEKERDWDKFRASQIFVHLIEELGELSRYISYEEGYKPEGLGHDAPTKDGLSREFAQSFSLFVQLANHFNIDLEEAVLKEMETMTERFPSKDWKEYMGGR